MSHLGAKHKLIEKYIDMKDYIKNHQEEQAKAVVSPIKNPNSKLYIMKHQEKLDEAVVKPGENMKAYVMKHEEEDTKSVVETNDLYVKDLGGIMVVDKKAVSKMPVKKM